MVNEEDDKKAAVPNGRSKRSKVFLVMVFLIVVYRYSGGFKHQMTEEEEERMLIEQAKGKTKRSKTDESDADLKKNVKMLKADSRLGFWYVRSTRLPLLGLTPNAHQVSPRSPASAETSHERVFY